MKSINYIMNVYAHIIKLKLLIILNNYRHIIKLYDKNSRPNIN